MKRTRFTRTALTLLCLLTPLALGAGPAADDYTPPRIETRLTEPQADLGKENLAKENLKLRLEVELLKSRVARLETRVKELEAGKPAPPKATPPKATPRPTPPQVVPKSVPKAPRFAPRESNPVNPASPRPLPEGWQEREFNGIKFYLVPLEAGAAKPGDANPAEVQPVQK